ncbi:gp2 [Streptomyces phage phiBT1]|uniref:Gp2 n=1 Tax=Lomovskayavirus BT1 TaxID=225588 RepID=Q858Z9_9CAUD|nr:gp2 [Streptomyces phage phiBT1]CAD80126.1 gp2 [Lomovskayavirus BT1]
MKDVSKVAAGFVAAIVAGFIVGAAGLSLGAFLVMILVGMWHGYNDVVPALGFVDCVYGVGLVILLGLIAAPATVRKQ